MTSVHKLVVIICSIFLGIFCNTGAFAAKNQRIFTLGPGFYTGSTTSTYSPAFSFLFGYHSVKKLGGGAFFSNSFRFGVAIGEEFGGAGAYIGMSGDYTFAPRLNFGKDGIVPWIAVGPMIAMVAASLASPPSTASRNQSAFKYGYSITTGFDKIADPNASGWGISVNFFKLLAAPSVFEFPYKSLTMTAVVLEIRYILETQ